MVLHHNLSRRQCSVRTLTHTTYIHAMIPSMVDLLLVAKIILLIHCILAVVDSAVVLILSPFRMVAHKHCSFSAHHVAAQLRHSAVGDKREEDLEARELEALKTKLNTHFMRRPQKKGDGRRGPPLIHRAQVRLWCQDTPKVGPSNR